MAKSSSRQGHRRDLEMQLEQSSRCRLTRLPREAHWLGGPACCRYVVATTGQVKMQ
ncbi:uncharacterized protein B0I36DRAFT_337515 [Microdochium trichocladiopsis]|uniref:Uncharacterized protein n=1 Tax=Microdochium trichocladiopsis TaxID=1682393 RepID=A0A9P8XUV8_9PEZI|nr:uncharacterized protein B0I36DRAFT_337515 [Microdochium trichocladiopsis]KAH7016379.1 hypothetical protein B0I36DRAFT_337515 [Microdochium trichocladiopsis]